MGSALLELYGPGKKTTVGRWVRAAKGMHEEVALYEGKSVGSDLYRIQCGRIDTLDLLPTPYY